MRVTQSGVIYDATQAPENARSCAFTSLKLLRNGDLLAAFRLGTQRDSPDGRLCIMRSQDEGRTWKTIHTGLTAIVDGIEGNLVAGFFTELPFAPPPSAHTRPAVTRHPATTGHPEATPKDDGGSSVDEGARGDDVAEASVPLLGAFAWVDRSNPGLSFVNPETAGILPMRVLLAESLDGGSTWQDFREIDLSPRVGCAVTGPVFALPGGVLAFPFESWKEYDDPSPGKHVASLRFSYDGGATWPEMATVAADPDARIFYWDQRVKVHPETGELVAMFWTHDRDAGSDIDNHIAWGTPDGRMWSTPISTGWRGQHCQPLPAGGDQLVALYVHRHEPGSLRAVMSRDFGRTWRRDEEIVFYTSEAGPEPGATGQRDFEDFWQDMLAWRFGHPRGVLLPDGDILVAFYAGDGHTTSMRWARITL